MSNIILQSDSSESATDTIPSTSASASLVAAQNSIQKQPQPAPANSNPTQPSTTLPRHPPAPAHLHGESGGRRVFGPLILGGVDPSARLEQQHGLLLGPLQLHQVGLVVRVVHLHHAHAGQPARSPGSPGQPAQRERRGFRHCAVLKELIAYANQHTKFMLDEWVAS